jgi:hypothetical protein
MAEENKAEKKKKFGRKNKIKHELGFVVWCQHKNTTLEKTAI